MLVDGNVTPLAGLFEYLFMFLLHRHLCSKQSAKGYERIIRESILRRSGYFSIYILLILMWIIFCCTIFLMSPLFCHNIINIWIAISVRGGQMEVDFWIFWVKKKSHSEKPKAKKATLFCTIFTISFLTHCEKIGGGRFFRHDWSNFTALTIKNDFLLFPQNKKNHSFRSSTKVRHDYDWLLS